MGALTPRGWRVLTAACCLIAAALGATSDIAIY